MGGKLIVFEGVEGAGKTTQIERSRRWFLERQKMRGETSLGNPSKVMVTREPGGTALGKGLRRMLLERGGDEISDRAELLLYAADRTQHVETVLKPELATGTLILCDRFTDSTVAYQGYGRGLDLKLIEQLNQIATGGLQSDLTLWLDLDVEIGLARAKARGASDRMEQAEIAFHQRVQQGFATLAQTNGGRTIRIDANRSEHEIAEEIAMVLNQKLTDWGY